MRRIAGIVLGAALVALAQDRSLTSPGEVLDRGLTVPWRDDAVGHPDLVRFRNGLMQAAKDHDLKAIQRAADPDCRAGCELGLGPDEVWRVRGSEGLRRYFLETAKGFAPWSAFYKSLSLGGVLSDGGKSFSSNYAVWTFPSEKTGTLGADYFEVIGGERVPVYESPASSSRILAQLSYDVVIPVQAEAVKGWQRIEFRKGKTGFVRSKNLLSPIGMVVNFAFRHGRWRLAGFSGYCE